MHARPTTLSKPPNFYHTAGQGHAWIVRYRFLFVSTRGLCGKKSVVGFISPPICANVFVVFFLFCCCTCSPRISLCVVTYHTVDPISCPPGGALCMEGIKKRQKKRQKKSKKKNCAGELYNIQHVRTAPRLYFMMSNINSINSTKIDKRRDGRIQHAKANPRGVRTIK